MAEFNPQDELLKRWVTTISESTRKVLARATWREEPDAARVLAAFGVMAVQGWLKINGLHLVGEDIDRDTDSLAALVRAELSGARRAMERARAALQASGPGTQEGTFLLAEAILEAFDGE